LSGLALIYSNQWRVKPALGLRDFHDLLMMWAPRLAPRTEERAGTARMNFIGLPADGLRFLRELADNNDPA
jgi:hypothetical protein